MERMNYVIDMVKSERKRQDAKWGEQNINVVEWIAVLTEEVGEASKEAVDYHFGNGEMKPRLKAGDSLQKERLRKLHTELIQVAAVAVQAVESIDRQTAHGTLKSVT